jgi:catechol 2,3-dioxygenase-like lactoylglutathione lyase family enzyme
VRSSVGAIVLHVSDAARARAFWTQALGYTSQPHNLDFLAPSDGKGPRLHLDVTDRTRLDPWVDRVGDQACEVERLLALGATRVPWDYSPDADFAVLADTEGNLFCVID